MDVGGFTVQIPSGEQEAGLPLHQAIAPHYWNFEMSWSLNRFHLGIGLCLSHVFFSLGLGLGIGTIAKKALSQYHPYWVHIGYICSLKDSPRPVLVLNVQI